MKDRIFGFFLALMVLFIMIPAMMIWECCKRKRHHDQN